MIININLSIHLTEEAWGGKKQPKALALFQPLTGRSRMTVLSEEVESEYFVNWTLLSKSIIKKIRCCNVIRYKCRKPDLYLRLPEENNWFLKKSDIERIVNC